MRQLHLVPALAIVGILAVFAVTVRHLDIKPVPTTDAYQLQGQAAPINLTEVPPRDCNDPLMSSGDQCLWVFTPTPQQWTH